MIFFVQTMTTEETSKLSLPEKFYKNMWDIDQMKLLSANVVLSLFTPSFRRLRHHQGG